MENKKLTLIYAQPADNQKLGSNYWQKKDDKYEVVPGATIIPAVSKQLRTRTLPKNLTLGQIEKLASETTGTIIIAKPTNTNGEPEYNPNALPYLNANPHENTSLYTTYTTITAYGPMEIKK